MTTDVSTALATLQLDPDNKQALKALAGVHPGNGSGVDREALAKALTDARRWHRERGDFKLCIQLIDLELAWTMERPRAPGRPAAREGAHPRRRAAQRRGRRGLRQGSRGRGPRSRGGGRVAGADDAGARQLGADLRALPAAGRGGDRPDAGVQPLRIGGRVLPQVPGFGKGGGDLPAQEPGAGSQEPAIQRPPGADAARASRATTSSSRSTPSAPSLRRAARSARWPRCWRARSAPRSARPTRRWRTSARRWRPTRSSRGRCARWSRR